MLNKFFPSKIVLFQGYVEKYRRTRRATDDNIIRSMHFASWINKATETHSKFMIFIVFPR